MRTIQVYLHGVTMGTPGRGGKRDRTRGKVSGWSQAASRRNVAFLRSVEPESLPDSGSGPLTGWAFTMTVRDCPGTSADWHRLRRAFLMRLERLGAVRVHWVVEWQRRGVPHLHGAVWLPEAINGRKMVDHWLEVARSFRAGGRGQHVAPIHDAVGWFQYVAKHAARGVSHYQRAPESVPPGWRGETGRVWGRTGDWDTREPIKLSVTSDVFYRLRRLARAWRKSDARESGDAWRIVTARKMLRCPDRAQSELRGVSEWIDQETLLLLLDLARGSGRIES